MADISVRRFDASSEGDYASFAALYRTVLTDYARTVSELREVDEKYARLGRPWARWFAVADGRVIGVGEFVPAVWQPEPGKFFVRILVEPSHQGCGIGKTLYAALLADCERHSPIWLRCEWREDMTRAVRFFRERGFVEVSRYSKSRLDLAAFDFSPFAVDYYKPLSHGIVFRTWREMKESDPDADRKLWTANMAMAVDVPSDEPFQEMSFDDFQTLIMARPKLDPDGFIVALDETTGEYVGISHIWRRQSDNDIDTGLTAVKRTYRRRGIALAMKLRIVRWAREKGFRAIRTSNEVNNRAILSINERLGFQKLSPWLDMVWRPEG